MIIYNVTCNVEKEILQDWIQWMIEIHIPDVMQTGFFLEANINKVISSNDAGTTYAIAYSCESMKKLHEYQIKFSAELQKKHMERYGEKVVAFRTILELIRKF
tara:strand:+ start:3474 stop:3782 length:309 start_codon:yes stop_codon:yes gene_type:complete